MLRRPETSFPAIAAGLAILPILALLACSGGNGGNDGGFAAASATIGPGGGQLSSSDGRLSLIFPAGAVAAPTLITITPLAAADLSPAAQGLEPDRAYRIDPAGMTLAQPAQLSFDMSAAVLSEGTGLLPVPPVRVVFADDPTEPLPGLKTLLDSVIGLPRADATIGRLGELLFHESRYGNVTVTPPLSIPAGGSAPVTATIDTSLSTDGSNASWRSVTTNVTDDLSDTFVPFTGSYNLFCPGMATSGGVTLTIKYTAQIQLGTPEGILNQSEEAVAEFVFPVVCQGMTGASVIPGVVSLAGILDSVESIQVISRPGSNFEPTGHPIAQLAYLLVAGEIPGGGGPGAAIVDPSNWTLPSLIPVGGLGTAFDAHLIPSPGGTREALFTSGTEGFLIETLPGGNLASGGLLSMGFHEDASEVADDPANGIAAAIGATLRIASIDDSLGVQFQDYGFSQQVRSAAVNATRTRALVIRATSNDLVEAILDPTSGLVISENLVRGLGSAPRRIRWDPSSGLVGISDFVDSTVTVLSWDGATTPSMIGTANVGLGPVGIDIVDGNVLSVGFGDDSFTRIGVDLINLSIAQVTTLPIPFTPVNGTSFNPGHVKAIGDADKSVVISNFGDQSVTFLGNAYP